MSTNNWKNVGSYNRSKNNEIVRATNTNITQNLLLQPNNLNPKLSGVSFADNTFQYTAAHNIWNQGDPSYNIYYDVGAVSVNSSKPESKIDFTLHQIIENENKHFANQLVTSEDGTFLFSTLQANNATYLYIYIYSNITNDYELLQTIGNTSPSFAQSISISNNNQYLAIGDPNNNKVFFYEQFFDESNNKINFIFANSLSPPQYIENSISFGSSVSISSFQHGSYLDYALVVSDIGVGSIYFYANDFINNPTNDIYLIAVNEGDSTDVASKMGFSTSIQYIDQNNIYSLVSAPYRDVGTLSDAGEIVFYQFTKKSNNAFTDITTQITKEITYHSSTIQNNGLFGYKVDFLSNPQYFACNELNTTDFKTFKSNMQLFSNDSTNCLIKLKPTIAEDQNTTFGYSFDSGSIVLNNDLSCNLVVGDYENNLTYLYKFNLQDVSSNNYELLFSNVNTDISFGKQVTISNAFEGENKNIILGIGKNNQNSEEGAINIYYGGGYYDFNVEGYSYFDGDIKVKNNVVALNSIITDQIYCNNVNYPQDGKTINLGKNVNMKSLSVEGGKQFLIKHPLSQLNHSHDLIHYCIEAPQMDLYYSGEIDLLNGKANVNLDTLFKMSQGTFSSLNINKRVFTTNETGWDPVKGKIQDNNLHIECKNHESNDTISFLVIGERNDKAALEMYKANNFSLELKKE